MAASGPRSKNSRTASPTISGGNARIPCSGRSNEAIILKRSACSPADEARPNTCRPVGMSRCSISSNCSYSAKTRASRSVSCLGMNRRRQLHKLRLDYLGKPSRLFTRLKLFLRINHDHARLSLPQRDVELAQLRFDLQMTQSTHVEALATERNVGTPVREQ